MGERRDPCRPVDAQPDEALPGLFGTAGVEAHPDPDRRVVRPRLGGKRPLCRDGGFDGIGRLGERDEEGIALGALLDAAMSLAAARRISR